MASVTVITPSIAKPELITAIKSVQSQTYPTKHVIVVDGPDYNMPMWDRMNDLTEEEFGNPNLIFSVAPTNTGANGFRGQRIYAAYPHLLDSDYILFLDEDNFYEPNHVETLIHTIEKHNLPFAYSLRKIYSKDGKYLCNDDCESLGKWEIFFTRNQHPHYMVDTSAYCFKREFIQATCHVWHGNGWGEDRRYYNAVRNNPHDTSGEYTLCYRLGGNEGSVTEDFFRQGNEIQKLHFGGNYPWRKI